MSQDPQFIHAHRTPFHDEAGEAILRRFDSHWHTSRGSRTVPSRADLNSGILENTLSHSFFLERVTPTVARFRVAGQAIHTHLGMEPRGMPISAVFTPAGRQMLAPLIYDVCENPAIVEVPLIAQRRFAFGSIRARLLMMPVRTIDREINMICGAMVMDGSGGSRSLRFDIDPDYPLRTEHVRPAIRTVHEVLTDVPHVAQTASEVTPRAPEPSPAPRLSGLRLVVDNT